MSLPPPPLPPHTLTPSHPHTLTDLPESVRDMRKEMDGYKKKMAPGKGGDRELQVGAPTVDGTASFRVTVLGMATQRKL